MLMQGTQETQVQSLSQEDPLEKEWQPAPVLLRGEFHGQRSLVGYSPKGHKESEQLSMHIFLFTFDFHSHPHNHMWNAFR